MTSNPEVSKVEKIWPEVNNAFFPYGFKWLANSGPNCYWDRIPAIIQMQKEIEMTGDEYPDDSIAKEIDDQLKLINENLVK